MALVPVDEWPAGHTRIDSRIIAVDPRAGMGPWGPTGYLEMSRWLPDLDDAATIGCLLRLVRDAWGDPHAYVLACGGDWFTVCSPDAAGGKWLRIPPIDGATEPAALVAALLAAP